MADVRAVPDRGPLVLASGLAYCPFMAKELALTISPARWVFAIGVNLALVLGFFGLAIAAQGAFAVQVLFAAMGTGFAALAWRQYGLRDVVVRLTDTGLELDDGTMLAPLDEIRRVDRSAFAFKPSNGFIIVLDRPRPALWQPGLYWRIGRRVGVGGMMNGGFTRLVADELTVRLAKSGR